MFHNGHPLTSADVKFSIERAARLDVPGSSASLLSSLRRIETPDDLTVRFLLSRPDTQFGWALASPAASIVDAEVYDADRVREPEGPDRRLRPVRGGQASRRRAAAGPLRGLRRPHPGAPRRAGLPHRGRTRPPSRTRWPRARSTWCGAASTRRPSPGSASRSSRARRSRPTSGYRPHGADRRTRAPAAVVARRRRARSSKALRDGHRLGPAGGPHLGLGGARPGSPATRATFPLGGKATPKVTWKSRINLTLGYDPTTPNGRDLAIQIRTRLEDTGGLSVKLAPGEPDADCAGGPQGVDGHGPGLAAALPRRAAARRAPRSVNTMETAVPRHHRGAAADRLLAALQRQSRAGPGVAADQPVRRVHRTPAPGSRCRRVSFGPGWQLGLWGIGGG